MDFPETGCRPSRFLLENDLKGEFANYREYRLEKAAREWAEEKMGRLQKAS